MSARAFALTFIAFALVAARPPLRFQPDPSSVIAAEIAFHRLAQQKGQWTAFRAMAAEDAVMFAPQRVPAQTWLKGRADPPASVRWSPQSVFVSCDGALAASTGDWTRADGSVGYFTRIWRRDRKGDWRWILDHGDRLAGPRPSSDELSGRVATCKGRGPSGGFRSPPMRGNDAPAPPPDDSLTWSADVATDGGRHVVVKMWTGDAYETVIDDRVAAGTS